MAERITETLVKKLPSPTKGNKIAYDSDLKGFGVRVTAAGAKAFVLNYRTGGLERRYTIGSYPEWSATAARKHAEDLKRRIDLGQDPLAHRREERGSLTINQLCELYAERHLPKKGEKSQRDDMAIIRTIVNPRCSATIWVGKQRQSGRPFWRSRRSDDCRGATITQGVFSCRVI